MTGDIVYLDKPATGFCCERLPSDSGYTWTLTTRLGQLLREAETRFGPRDSEWTPLGIEFGGENPRTWYPGNCKNVSIKLSTRAADDPRRALFQLAHEVIHLLSPGRPEATLVIEEGVATFFSLEVCEWFNLHFTYGDPAYDHAAERVSELLALDPHAVKRLRQERPAFSDFTPEFIRDVLPLVPERLAVELCQLFAAVRGTT